MDKYKEIRDNLIFTEHGRDNLRGTREDNDDRTDISVHKIVLALMYGTPGFAGNGRFKVSYNGIKVLFKRDDEGKYVIITYYKSKLNPKKKRLYRAFDKINSQKITNNH